jgi:1,4-dihydroxy-2-naphthoate octaprenyltransferase
VALVAAAVTAGTFPLLGLSLDPSLLVLAASGAFLVYQLDRGLVPSPEDAINRPTRTRWVRHYAPYVRLSSGAAVLAGGWALTGQPPAVWLLTALLGAAGIGYALRDRIAGISPFGRRLEILKPAVIAGVWALGAVLLPVAANPAERFEWAVLLLVLYRWGAIVPNLLRADWPDRAGDRAVGRSTPAVRWGLGFSRGEFLTLVLFAQLWPFVLWLGFGLGPWVLLPLALLPEVVVVARAVRHHDTTAALFPYTPRTSRLATLHGVLLGLGLALSG